MSVLTAWNTPFSVRASLEPGKASQFGSALSRQQLKEVISKKNKSKCLGILLLFTAINIISLELSR